MKAILYNCYETGDITETETEYTARFIAAKKYAVLYREELPRFKKEPLNVYGLPCFEEPKKIYNGTDRDALTLADRCKPFLDKEQKRIVKALCNDPDLANTFMQRESTALQYIELFRESENYELIWVRASGTDDEIPSGYKFIGYDVSYIPDYTGSFSIICDCMFICRWHGCDETGTLFVSDFDKLNDNGLFDNHRDACDYMIKYLNQDWTERGEYGIFEIYKAE